ncbi:30 kDa spicule matrix protein-like [Diadema antillarum]|uniref:30 kDa spicule matrix protein-like n=1 Tax=Diadema antillarum TaxID=105358 RepID=UPI003A888563
MVGGLTQQQANQFCMQRKQGASLVTVNSPGENDQLFEWALRTYVEPPAMWIGLFVNTSKQWEWYSGESLDYTNWGETTPSSESGTGALLFDADQLLWEQLGAVNESPRWVPEQVLGESHYFICEYKLQMQIPAPEAPAAAAEQPNE